MSPFSGKDNERPFGYYAPAKSDIINPTNRFGGKDSVKTIKEVRTALDVMKGRMDFTPEEDFHGNLEGISTETIWDPELHGSRRAIEDGPVSTSGETGGGDDVSGLPAPEVAFEFGAPVDDMQPLLKGVDGERIRKSVEVKGIDALGYYVSFHARHAQWGIYIPVSGIAYMVQSVFDKLTISRELKCQLAFHSILNHELFHFASDYAVAQLEMISNELGWVPTRQRLLKDEPHYIALEEKLANAHMLKRMRSRSTELKKKEVLNALRTFVSAQPLGYREGGRVRASQWKAELNLLATEYFDFQGVSIYEFPIEFSVLYPLSPTIDWRYCPLHIIHDERRLNIPNLRVGLIMRIEKIDESKSFLYMLEKLPPRVRKKWEKFKRMASVALTNGMGIQKWADAGADTYSVRVDGNYRAHLKFQAEDQSWTALQIGNHAEMGHG